MAALVIAAMATCAVRGDDPLSPSMAWQRLAEMPVGVFDAAISQSGRFVVVTGGLTQSGEACDWVQLFDLDNLSWQEPYHIGLGVCMHTQVTLPDGRILIAGGMTGQLPGQLKAIDNAYLIDPVSSTVTPLAPLPQRAPMPTAHVLPDGTAIVIGGIHATVFDPETRAWTNAIRLREWRRGHGTTVLDDGRILVAGGLHRDSFEIIDPHARAGPDRRGISRMLAARLPIPIDDLELLLLPGHRVWILGGQSTLNGNTTDRTWVLDVSQPNTSRITDGPRLGVAGGIADHCVIRVGPWVILAGGESQQSGRDTELSLSRLLDPTTLSVWSLPSLRTPHDDAVAIGMPDGVIVFGGFQMKSMAFPSVQIGSDASKKRYDLPCVSVPFASAGVERLIFPQLAQHHEHSMQPVHNDTLQVQADTPSDP